ncbi:MULTISPECIES: SHOCT domain-containing protein [Rhodococcus]|uniref:DUF6325 family protein n=1 Tax=Rhodococcus oxybenzonivorans TaxID=1990687 RepID=A0AAE5A8K4_9NOCA|nr:MULTISPECIES: DUF6325 family protein [Rhodococcus]MDV7242931.1 DUF6325 family protein [Rhodococcus oxybenzonivorans]MDV7267621.1 DUF6325 family protein [Rhodococcus oxybenzonivorans]MDV7275335.1 DUF6325 family protein [Rhodococcus oxybenzonivorans]MDV7334810.1 DUF6325 family protein [Rhodococcus oxybenzonivorans]MDV7344964.1 DUF6325 family protein [Rhodococcus oxybenzonivorans]
MDDAHPAACREHRHQNIPGTGKDITNTAADVGPVAFLFLTFPGDRADPAVIESFRELVEQGTVTILDLVFLAKSQDGTLRQVEVDEELDNVGLAALSIEAKALISGDDLVSRIQELARLKDAGVLTDEEFAAAKAKLLGS